MVPEDAGIGLAPQSLAKGGLGADPFRVVAGEDQHLRGDVDADPEGFAQRRCCLGGEGVEQAVVPFDLALEVLPAPRQRPQSMFGGRQWRIEAPRPKTGAALVSGGCAPRRFGR